VGRVRTPYHDRQGATRAPIDRVKAATHDGAGWTVTITRMRQVHVAPIDDAQARRIIDLLAGGGA
jgi:hypothetical protein